MHAGILYASFGPFVLFALFLTYVFVSFRRPLWGAVAFAAWVPSVWFWSYDLPTRALLTGGALGVLAMAAVVGRERTNGRPVGFPRPSGPDVAIGVFALLMAVGAVRGMLADVSRSALAADVYHHLVAGPLVYAAVRLAVPAPDLPRFLGGWIGATAIVALLQVGVLALYPVKPEWIWMVGAPLDEGGVRLKPDFGFPTFAAAAALVVVAFRARPRDAAALAALLAAAVLTYKRTFWIAGAWGGVSMLALDRWTRRRSGAGPVRRPLVQIAAAGGVAIGLATLVGMNAESLRERAGGLADPLGVDTVESRLVEFGPTVAHIVGRPLGIGLGATIEIPTETGTRRAHYVHNAYLQWTLLGGVPAGLSMAACIGLVIVRVVRGRRDRWLLPVGASVIAAVVSGLAVQSFYSPLAAMSLALVVTRTDARHITDIADVTD